MDLFAKCYAPSMADQYREKGIYPYFRALETRQGPEVVMEGKRRIMLGSNNYLGLTSCPEVVEAGVRALEEFGTGCSGSRFLNGTLTLHLELEDELARFLRKEAVMTFSTGFQSNLGIISALVGRSDYMILDRENHASIYDGTRLSFGKMLRYRHGDMADLERCLQQVPESAGALVITDGVFSMGGDIADLPSIVRLAKQYGARVMVDDAGAPPAISASSERWTCTWAPSPSPWPAWAGTWPRTREWWITCATTPGPSSSPPPSRPPAAPRPWRLCGIWSSTRSCRSGSATSATISGLR